MDTCLTGCLIQLMARYGYENMGKLFVALTEMAAQHSLLDCELVNRELKLRGIEKVQVDEAGLRLALEALQRSGFVEAAPVAVN